MVHSWMPVMDEPPVSCINVVASNSELPLGNCRGGEMAYPDDPLVEAECAIINAKTLLQNRGHALLELMKDKDSDTAKKAREMLTALLETWRIAEERLAAAQQRPQD
jgi:hypothetical protein